MFAKRPDKYTTGLINLRNDCFANSSVQAYLALPGLTDYLNKFITSFNELSAFAKSKNIDINNVIHHQRLSTKNGDSSAASTSKFKNTISKFDISLHIGLADIIKKLQETQMASRTISVWTFLHVLEGIFNAKISRSQHDAHELTQLINETLENENIKIKNLHKYIKTNLHTILGLRDTPSPRDYSTLDKIQVPEFPFSGLTLSQLKCLKCLGVSTPNFAPFLMITLHTPQKLSSDIEDMLNDNKTESIEGYQCLKCRIVAIINNENHMKRTIPDQDVKHINELKKLNNNSKLCINDDLPKELEDFIRDYNVGGVNISQITSTVFRHTQILKPPKIFGVHLSRSSFNGGNATRNPCKVSFKEHLTLSIGKEYHEQLRQFQHQAEEEEEKQLESKIEVTAAHVLTRDVNDMEDEDVQREDVDVKGTEDVDVEANVVDNGTSTDDAGEENDLEDNDTSSTSTEESMQPSVSTTATMQNSSITNASDKSRTINSAPISDDQSEKLRDHFKKFKFNENDVYKYRLKAMIKHQGSHTQGHYECYKKKPLFVKDKDGNIFKLFPEIIDDFNGDTTYDVVPATSSELASVSMRTSSEGTKSSINTGHSSLDKRRSSSNSSMGSKDGNVRRRLSTMMGRRPSVFQADPEEAGIQEIVNSGSATPAELLVDEPREYFSAELALAAISKSVHDSQNSQHSDKVKMKKIPSAIKQPYWRISDSKVTEVSRSTMMLEMTSVYMLYYERVDRKQIKHSQIV